MRLTESMVRRGSFYSLEFFPPKEKEKWPDFFAVTQQLQAINPLFVSVTYGAGGGTQESTLGITAKLAQEGLRPMAHLTCVKATEEKIIGFLEQLEQSGVTAVLALRGDVPAGETIHWEQERFRFSSDLVSFIKQHYPHFDVAVAAYPMAHPQSATLSEDRVFTKNKLDKGGDFAITQLFFDAREYIEFIEQLRSIGVKKPIIPGVLPIQSLGSIRRILSLSGGNIPAKLYLALEEAHQKGGDEAVKEAGFVFAVEQIKRLLDAGAPGIHLYTLNKADMCLRIVEEVGKL